MIHGILSVGGLYVLLGVEALLTVADKIVTLFH